MPSASTAITTIVFCPALNWALMRATRSRRTCRNPMSDLHPHDLGEGVDGLVADRDGELGGDLRLGGRDHEVVDVGELTGRGLHAEVVGLVLHAVELVEGAGEGVVEAAALRALDGLDRRLRRDGRQVRERPDGCD